MLKNLTFLATLFLSTAYAQIEISNKLIPEINNATDGIYVNFSKKGVFLPRVSLNSLTELMNSSGVKFPAPTDTSQMIVYNTNRALGEGFHFWDGAKWRALLDFENVIAQLNSSTMFYKDNVNGISISANENSTFPTVNPPGYSYNQSNVTGGISDFKDIGVNQTIFLNRTSNKVSFAFTGIAQLGNVSTAYLSFSIGLFVDGKLKYVDLYASSFTVGCSFISVNFEGILQDLPLGAHTIEVRYHPRRAYDTTTNTNLAYNFGIKHNQCSNLQNNSMTPKLVVTVKE